MVFCRNCGSQNEDGAAFCKNCGARISPVDSRESRHEARMYWRLRVGALWGVAVGILVVAIGLSIAYNLSFWNWIWPVFLILVGVIIITSVMMRRRPGYDLH
ncbi:MAG: zinc ribbon domain-containing protein [Candidatus Methanomethylicaceae archaeon]|jgi:uncharacterized integral membrane protein